MGIAVSTTLTKDKGIFWAVKNINQVHDMGAIWTWMIFLTHRPDSVPGILAGLTPFTTCTLPLALTVFGSVLKSEICCWDKGIFCAVKNINQVHDMGAIWTGMIFLTHRPDSVPGILAGIPDL
ncbi:hypothetical protein ACJX0J_041871, partial [Zea mays]